MSLKARIGVYMAGKVAESLIDRVSNANQSEDPQFKNLKLKDLVKEHGAQEVQNMVDVLKSQDREALESMFGSKDDRERVREYVDGGDSLYTQDELRRMGASNDSQNGDSMAGVAVAADVATNPMAREALGNMAESGVLAEQTSALGQARSLMMGDGVVDSGELLATIGVKNGQDLALGDALTVEEQMRLREMGDAPGMS